MIFDRGICCHKPTEVTTIGSVSFYGASQSGATFFDGDVMINFTKFSDIPSVMQIPELAKFVKLKQYKEIMVPWPDFGLPQVDIEFWPALYYYLESNSFDKVCFHCEAGHGRTGTALSAMLISVKGLSIIEAVGLVRNVYCKEAVETSEQLEYLLKLDCFFNGRDKVIEYDRNYPTPSIDVVLHKRWRMGEDIEEEEEEWDEI